MSLFRKAVKEAAKLRLSIAGPSGSGKTFTALTFAQALSPSGKIAVLDTEHGSASKYADLFDFDVAELSNFHPNNYVKAIKDAAAAGYEVVILDSITHAWNGPGGILSIVNQNFGKWKDVAPIEQAFIEAIVGSPIHIIATMRAKTQYEVEKDEKTGKPTPRKVGMGAIQRQDMEYEFDIATMMDTQNTIMVEKTRCPAVTGVVVNRPDASFMTPIIDWLQGAPAQPKPASDPATDKVRDEFNALGEQLYGEQWPTVRKNNADRISNGTASDYERLTIEQLQRLITGMESLRLKRQAASKPQPQPEAAPVVESEPASEEAEPAF